MMVSRQLAFGENELAVARLDPIRPRRGKPLRQPEQEDIPLAKVALIRIPIADCLCLRRSHKPYLRLSIPSRCLAYGAEVNTDYYGTTPSECPESPIVSHGVV
jgi:hypothetical protein